GAGRGPWAARPGRGVCRPARLGRADFPGAGHRPGDGRGAAGRGAGGGGLPAAPSAAMRGDGPARGPGRERRRAPTPPRAPPPPPGLAGGRPGTYWFTPKRPPAGPGGDTEVVPFHGAVPGHHLHLSRLQLLTELPALQRQRSLPVFAEGWGLYAEQLAEE